MMVGCSSGSMHLEQHVERPGAVHARGLIELVGNALQRRQEDQEAERRPLPDIDEDDREQRPVRDWTGTGCRVQPSGPPTS